MPVLWWCIHTGTKTLTSIESPWEKITLCHYSSATLINVGAITFLSRIRKPLPHSNLLFRNHGSELTQTHRFRISSSGKETARLRATHARCNMQAKSTTYNFDRVSLYKPQYSVVLLDSRASYYHLKTRHKSLINRQQIDNRKKEDIRNAVANVLRTLRGS